MVLATSKVPTKFPLRNVAFIGIFQVEYGDVSSYVWKGR